jgi:tRNA modification GTPase
MTSETIVALSTPQGSGALALIRLSGNDSIEIANSVWQAKKPLTEAKSHTVHYGAIVDPETNETIDECVATIYRAPRTFTGENIVEFSCHGSQWIIRQVLNLLVKHGARTARGGEFSMRAFMNGKVDLAQAEGIADLIASSSRAAHHMAMSQMKGRFSEALAQLNAKLVEFASLLELELDFSEEDVEFADRSRLVALAHEIKDYVDKLAASYSTGRALKDGVPVAIVGVPNSGKSTLLNALLGEDKAIVSSIAGTTRDVIEDCVEIDGILFRFIDTAGLRHTSDEIETIGISRAVTAGQKASIIIKVLDTTSDIASQQATIADYISNIDGAKVITVYNKCDLKAESASIAVTAKDNDRVDANADAIEISAKSGYGMERLNKALTSAITADVNPEENLMVTNARHYESLIRASADLDRALTGIADNLPADLIAMDVRAATNTLSEICGTITSDTLLHNIFAHFCIGK